MSTIELLKNELANSSLPENHREEFLNFIFRLPTQYQNDILEMSKEDEGFLNFLWSNYDRKNKAFKMHDEQLLDDILKEEKTLLDEMNKEI